MTDLEEIEGRAARLKTAFPGAYHQDGALVSFDMDTIRKVIGWTRPVETAAGLRFERARNGEIWVSLKTKVGNVSSAWSWRVPDAEWRQVVEGMGLDGWTLTPPKIAARPCELCGTRFLPGRAVKPRRFCSDRCRWTNAKRNQRARELTVIVWPPDLNPPKPGGRKR